jgi:hypothetical protein
VLDLFPLGVGNQRFDPALTLLLRQRLAVRSLVAVLSDLLERRKQEREDMADIGGRVRGVLFRVSMWTAMVAFAYDNE